MQPRVVVELVALLPRGGADADQRADLAAKAVFLRPVESDGRLRLRPGAIEEEREAVREAVEEREPGRVAVVDGALADEVAQVHRQRPVRPEIAEEVLAQPRRRMRAGRLEAAEAGRREGQRGLLPDAHRLRARQQRAAPARRRRGDGFEPAHHREVVIGPGLGRPRLHALADALAPRGRAAGRSTGSGVPRTAASIA